MPTCRPLPLPTPHRICIDNLFEKKWDHVSASYAEANLKFKKMPLGEAPPQTGNLRRRQVRGYGAVVVGQWVLKMLWGWSPRRR